MIGNDLPALKEMFSEYKNGIIVDYECEKIKRSILEISCDYENYVIASKNFYESVDLPNVVKKILGAV